MQLVEKHPPTELELAHMKIAALVDVLKTVHPYISNDEIRAALGEAIVAAEM